ncbi:nuclear pore complex assembly-domain-containing protein [Scleroderma yunnanense]
MDIDEPDAVAKWFNFFASGDFPWSEDKVSEVESRRARMADLLIFDVLLIRGGIRQPDMYYPPVDMSSLRRLLCAIDTSTYDTLKKDCLIYILLKWYPDNRETRFQEDRCIPPQFVALADAYWHLDTGHQVARAVSILSDSRLNRDYVSKILQALTLDDNPSPLVVKYVRTAKPHLTEPDDIDLYTLSLANSSFLDAWQYQRTFSESSPTRTRLLHKLFEWCLSPTSRPEPLSQLIGFPLTPFEQSLLTSYALNPPSSLPQHAVTVLQELVCVRLIQSADYVAAIKLDRQFTAVSGSSSSKERKQLMNDLISTLPPAERWLLEGELGQVATGVRVAAPSSSLNGQRERREFGRSRVPLGDLSMSWDEIRSSPSASASIMKNGQETTMSPSPAAPSPGRFALGNNLSRTNANGSGLSMGQNPFTLASPAGKPSQSIVPPFAVLGPRPTTSGTPRSSTSGVLLSTVRDDSGPAHANPPQASLFEKAGSAKHAPNAFYKPPVSSSRTSIGAPLATPAPLSMFVNTEAATSGDTPAEEGMSVGSEGPMSEGEDKEDSDDMDDVPDIGYSVFGDTAATMQPQKKKSSSKGYVLDAHSPSPPLSMRELVQGGKHRAPPGAFHTEEDESDGEPPSPRRSTRTRSRTSVSAHRTTLPHKTSRATRAIKGARLSQSIPGSLIDEDEEHGEATVKEEEEDDVAPLPPSRPPRKSRVTATSSKSKVSGTTSKAAAHQRTPSRRSSRLSTASLSPDGPDSSPPSKSNVAKPRKSTRTSNVGTSAVATRSSARRKR